jgi:hypothetical protein
MFLYAKEGSVSSKYAMHEGAWEILCSQGNYRVANAEWVCGCDFARGVNLDDETSKVRTGVNRVMYERYPHPPPVIRHTPAGQAPSVPDMALPIASGGLVREYSYSAWLVVGCEFIMYLRMAELAMRVHVCRTAEYSYVVLGPP